MDSRHNMDQTIVISRRERIATACLQSLLTNPLIENYDGPKTYEFYAREAVEHADALIRRLDEEGER